MKYEVAVHTQWLGRRWRERTLAPGQEIKHFTSTWVYTDVTDVRVPNPTGSESGPVLIVDQTGFYNMASEYTQQAPGFPHAYFPGDMPHGRLELTFPQGVRRRWWRSRLHVGVRAGETRVPAFT